MCISPAHFFKLAKLDYVGILAQICGSMVGTIHFILDCHHRVKVIYLIVCVASCASSLPILFSKKFAGRKYDKLRALTFVGIASVAIAPVAHAAIVREVGIFRRQCFESYDSMSRWFALRL